MTRRVDIFGEKMMELLACVLMLICVITSCTSRDEEPESDEAWVTLSVATDTDPMMTRADDGTSNNKDWSVNDITVYVFDSKGQVIGSTFSTPNNITNNSFGVDVKARKAQGCTVIAVANAKDLSGDMPFAGVSTLPEFKQKYLKFADAATMQNANSLLMMGKLTGFDTSTGSATISLQRLASKLEFTITVNNDKNTGSPIVVDSYQLCHLPMSAYYAPEDMANISLPGDNTFGNFTEITTPIQSWDATPATYTEYVYANPSTDNQTATYLYIKAHAQASSTDTRKIWESQFKVYLQGATKTDDNSALAAYTILPNYHYKIGITIQGSITSTNGVIVDYQARPYYNPSLAPWGADENKDLDLQ